MSKRIILASRSPARFKLLQDEGWKVIRSFPDVNESRLKNEPVRKYAIRIALAKAKKVAKRHPTAIIIAVDTIIALGQEIYGKPRNKKEARKTIKKLSGRWHKVYSGTVIMDTKKERVFKKVVATKVKFNKLSDETIDWYIKTGESMKAAGAYSIQNEGKKLIEIIDGCFTNVVGVSIPFIRKVLKELKAI